jgi:molecular chaperone GrpE
MTPKKIKDKKKEKTKKNINLKKEYEKLKIEIKEKNDKLIRTIADFQNYQKRIEKEFICHEQETKKKYLELLLDINELLKKAYNDNNPKEGLKLLINNIENFFQKEQIKPINCIGEKFNHNIHHAITTLEKNDCEDNIIIEEIKKGYMLDDKILRPSHVIVTKKIKNKN